MLSFKKSPDGIRRMLRFSVIFSNAAFMGMPLIESVIGAEALIYASIYNITFNAWLWTLGVQICTANRDVDGDGIDDGEHLRKKGGASLKRVLLHPTMLAAAIGLVCFFLSLDPGTNYKELPVYSRFIVEVLDGLKALVAPLSMVVIGLRMATLSLRGAASDGHMWLFLGLRHFFLPALVLGFMWLFSALGIALGETVCTVVLLLAATPAATSATMFAEKYDCDTNYISRMVLISTLLSLVSMPLLVLLMDAIL